MIHFRAVIQIVIPCVLLLCTGPTAASSDVPRYHSNLQDVIEQVVEEVVEIKIRDAHNEIQVRIGADGRDYDRGNDYRYQPYRDRPDYSHHHNHLSYEERRALRRLDAEHERAIRRLEAELEYKLREAEHDFRHDVRRAHNGKKIGHQRKRLSKEVDKAYHRFHRKMAKEVDRFDEQRDRILSRRWDA